MDYYLYIEPYTLFFRKRDECLFYNTLEKKALKMNVVDDIRSIIDALELESFVKISDDKLSVYAIILLIKKLQQTFNGDILPASDNNVPPAVFYPLVNNQREFERLNSYEWLEKDGQVMNYLEEVYLYLNGYETEEDDEIWKQFPSYLCSSQILDSGKLMSWLETCADKQINRINLLGGDVLLYPNLEELLIVLQKKAININLYCRYDRFSEAYNNLFVDVIEGLTWVVPMWQFDKRFFLFILAYSSSLVQSKRWLFLITSEKEYEIVEQVVEMYALEFYSIKPIYVGHNLSFFREFVFLCECDVLDTIQEKRDFYVSQKINKNDFGRITVMPDGKVYANVNHPSIGNLDGKISTILYKEMADGCSWLRIRNQKPCCDCIYQWLCPSPSNYELVIGIPNLCLLRDVKVI